MNEHKTLAEAKVAFQGAAPKLVKGDEAKIVSQKGSFSYKYIDLPDVVEAIQPLMLEHGLSFSAFPCYGPDGNPALRYELEHASGDKETEVMPLMLAKPDAQALGSAITYARRYALCAALNIVADVDDDGKAASKRQEASGRANGSPQATAAPAQATERPATAKQRGLIFAKAGEAQMKASELANVVLISTGSEERDFESQEAAQEWLKRALDRLPANRVNTILEHVAAA